MDYLRHNHRQFCELLYAVFDDPPSENFYYGIPCSALPTLDGMFQKKSMNCIYATGFAKRIHLNNLNIYDAPYKINFNKMPYSGYLQIQLNHLEYLDLSASFDNEYPYHPTYFRLFHTVPHFNHLKVLNASNSGITNVGYFTLSQFPNLQVLDMSRNSLTTSDLDLSFVQSIKSFVSNGNIRVFSFAYNLIQNVPTPLFLELASLHELDLSHNHIEDFDFNISGLHSLENLNMAYNKLSDIPSATQQQLIQLAERVAPRNITVDLSGNPLPCSCSNIPYLTFMHQTKPSNLVFHNNDGYMCHDQAGNLINLHRINLHALWWDCLGPRVYVGIGVAITTGAITIISALAIFIYRKRWWFRYQYFLANRVWKNYHKTETLDTPFEYDLFVSYNQHDYQWVDKVLQPKLEDELGLRLCLHHRDFRLGEIITEQIIESIQSSKKTLFILSKSFLASTWCHFEIRMAQTRLFRSGEDVILLALLERLPDHMVSKTLKGLLETRTYVDWTENDTYGQKLFWEKLYESVKSPIAQPFDLEERAPPPGIQTEEMRDPPMEAADLDTEPLLVSSQL